MKIALVHDWLPFMGGAENVLANMVEVFPDAPIYTTVYNKNRIRGVIKDADIRTTHLQKKKEVKNHRKLFPYMPTAMESLDLNGYDVVLSSSSSVGKSVITNPDTLHICYCHTPMRYAWEFQKNYIGALKGKGSFKNKLKAYLMTFMRVWDYSNSARVDVFVANSVNVAKRIKKHYKRDNIFVIRPPVRCNLFNISEEDGDFFLCVSRLQEYKRVDIAVEACTKLNVPLVVIGDGPEREKIEKIAGPNVKFLGRVSDDEMKEYYSKCKAFLFPGEEDYGITPLEAQASGRPVIAYGKGGALETVVADKTGVFFDKPNADSLIEAIKKFETMTFDKNELRAHAMEFDESVFRDKLERFVKEQYEQFQKNKLDGIEVYK